MAGARSDDSIEDGARGGAQSDDSIEDRAWHVQQAAPAGARWRQAEAQSTEERRLHSEDIAHRAHRKAESAEHSAQSAERRA